MELFKYKSQSNTLSPRDMVVTLWVRVRVEQEGCCGAGSWCCPSTLPSPSHSAVDSLSSPRCKYEISCEYCAFVISYFWLVVLSTSDPCLYWTRLREIEFADVAQHPTHPQAELCLLLNCVRPYQFCLVRHTTFTCGHMTSRINLPGP